MTKYLNPKCFIFGILIGFIFCCIYGYFISRTADLGQFSRFYRLIQPESFYYPTASELLETARHSVAKDKILVLIGGSSVLRGTGQDPDEVWSDTLQQLLGDQYKVLNYAADGASFSSFGGAAFRMLRQEYPKIIFIAGAYQLNSEGRMDGLPPYDYLFWDAYYKHLFSPSQNEAEIIKKIRKEEMSSKEGMELHLMSFLDSYFYFRNLWNWVSYHYLFTMFSEFVYNHPFKPRHIYHEELLDPPLEKRFIDEESFRNYQKIIQQTVVGQINDFSQNPLQIKPNVLASAMDGYDKVFQPEDRNKILMVLTTYNTRIIASIPKKFQNGYWTTNEQTHILLKNLGYHVIDVGKDFSGDDYLDIAHFRASGGKKAADQVAAEVKKIAELNGYITH